VNSTVFHLNGPMVCQQCVWHDGRHHPACPLGVAHDSISRGYCDTCGSRIDNKKCPVCSVEVTQ
jgi:predicted amidophosphoribosyltransferase